jgi:hypothetical protein
MRPDAMLVVLAGPALWPIASPQLGTGTAVGVIGGAIGSSVGRETVHLGLSHASCQSNWTSRAGF